MTQGQFLFNPKNSVDGIVTGFWPTDYAKQPLTAIAGKNVATKSKNRFGGKFDRVLVGMYITKVIYSDPATIVFWSDGAKTMSKAQHGDTYSKETGLALCVLKKLVGGEQVANLVKDWITEDTDVVDLKYLRDKEKGKLPIKEVETSSIITKEIIDEVNMVAQERECKKSKCKKCKSPGTACK